jgi:hypothetical protein
MIGRWSLLLPSEYSDFYNVGSNLGRGGNFVFKLFCSQLSSYGPGPLGRAREVEIRPSEYGPARYTREVRYLHPQPSPISF